MIFPLLFNRQKLKGRGYLIRNRKVVLILQRPVSFFLVVSSREEVNSVETVLPDSTKYILLETVPLIKEYLNHLYIDSVCIYPINSLFYVE